MDTPEDYLQRTLLREIPLTRAMGLTVEEYSGRAITLRAPLASNDNHQASAFGGSLYSAAVLAGWGLLFLKLREHGLRGSIVIQESRIRYLRPVTGDILATCRLDAESALDTFFRTYKRRGAARIRLACSVAESGTPAVAFEGRYVVRN